MTKFYSTAVSRVPGASDHPLGFSLIDGVAGFNFVDGVKEFKHTDDEEAIERYRPKDNDAVAIGDVLHKRYHIVHRLDFGGDSTVWLARDAHLPRYVAVKVGTADPVPQGIKTLKALSLPPAPSYSDHPGRRLISTPLDEFELHGPNGTCPCYVMAPGGCNLESASYSLLFPLEVARALCFGLTQAVAYTHSQGYVHGGLFCHDLMHCCVSLFLCQLTLMASSSRHSSPKHSSQTPKSFRRAVGSTGV